MDSIIVRIEEGPDGFVDTWTGIIEKPETFFNTRKVLSIKDVKINPVQKKPVKLETRIFENPGDNEKGYYVALEKEVQHSVENYWYNVQPQFIGEKIDYKITTLDGPSFYYSQPWGDIADHYESTVLKDPKTGPTYPLVLIQPRQSVNVALNAIENIIKIRIRFRCDNGKDTTYSLETITVKFYTDPTIDY